MRTVVLLGALLLCAFPGLAARSKKRHSAPRKHAAATAVKTSGTAASTPKTAATGHKKAASRTRAKKPKVTWRNSQMSPTLERYKEIQQALAGKGYSKQEPDGVWGPQWTESLKHFQQDQKLEPSGKLTALSLKALGLGAHRDNVTPAEPAPAGTASAQPVTRALP